MKNNKEAFAKGLLYIVPTPIGNLKDITLRGIEVLREVDIIACEDTRTAGKLLKLLNIQPKQLISYFDEKEEVKSERLLQFLKEGKKIALISEAGTPLISDPGFKIISKCIHSGIKIIPLPGSTAFVPALIASGLPLHQFTFLGFPPHKKGYLNFIDTIINSKITTITYISQYKIQKFIDLLSLKMGPERKICIAREISKINESFYYGTILEMKKQIEANQIPLKGEFVVIIEGKIRE